MLIHFYEVSKVFDVNYDYLLLVLVSQQVVSLAAFKHDNDAKPYSQYTVAQSLKRPSPPNNFLKQVPSTSRPSIHSLTVVSLLSTTVVSMPVLQARVGYSQSYSRE